MPHSPKFPGTEIGSPSIYTMPGDGVYKLSSIPAHRRPSQRIRRSGAARVPHKTRSDCDETHRCPFIYSHNSHCVSGLWSDVGRHGPGGSARQLLGPHRHLRHLPPGAHQPWRSSPLPLCAGQCVLLHLPQWHRRASAPRRLHPRQCRLFWTAWSYTNNMFMKMMW